MKDYTYLEVQFIFDPSSTWSHVSQFEADLADFFSAYGMEAQSVKTIGGQPGKKLFLVRKIDTVKRLDNKAGAVAKPKQDPRKSFKSENYTSFKSFSAKPLVPQNSRQQTPRMTKQDFGKGRQNERKVYLPK